MTRIDSSPFRMWKDILSSNRKEVGKALRLYIRQLNKIAGMIDTNPDRIADEFLTSRKLRSRIPRSMKGFHSRLIELSVYMSDKPGELARLTSALALNSINIKDIELLKVREGRGGTFRLSFENRAVAGLAASVLQEAGFDIGEPR
jgi:prephenate dehydrogenase